MKYAITGATGRFGQTAIKTLLEHVDAADIVALARNTEKAHKVLPDGVEIREGAYEDVDQLTESMAGVDRLLFISSQPGATMPRLTQHQNVVNAAKTAGVKFIAYTSFPHADTSIASLASDHRQTEKLIEQSGLAHAFLRNNWYLENDRSTIDAAVQNQPVAFSAGDGRVGWALEREYAEAAANVLLLDTPKNIYEFTGHPVTFSDLALAAASLQNQKPTLLSLDDAGYKTRLQSAGVNEGLAGFLTAFQGFIRDGVLSEESTDLETVLGHPLPSLAASVSELLKASK